MNLTVVKSGKDFGLIGMDILSSENNESIHCQINAQILDVQELPAIKGIKATMELVEGAKPMFCKARPVLALLA